MVDPETVKAPAHRLTLIKVLYNGGAGSFSVALVKWKDEDGGEDFGLGLRWNGEEGPSKGTPVSRGVPTWMILPKELNKGVLSSIKNLNPNDLQLQERVGFAEKILDL